MTGINIQYGLQTYFMVQLLTIVHFSYALRDFTYTLEAHLQFYLQIKWIR